MLYLITQTCVYSIYVQYWIWANIHISIILPSISHQEKVNPIFWRSIINSVSDLVYTNLNYYHIGFSAHFKNSIQIVIMWLPSLYVTHLTFRCSNFEEENIQFSAIICAGISSIFKARKSLVVLNLNFWDKIRCVWLTRQWSVVLHDRNCRTHKVCNLWHQSHF